jgi:mycofactocin system creatininase family protein
MALLAELPSPQVARGGLLVVPFGATEQHGPHLPLSTDTVIARALARSLDGPGVSIAPALAYGASGEHQAFPGTMSIGARALESVIVELVRSATETFSRVLLLNAHGGNAVPLTRAVAGLRGEGRDVRAWSPAAAWNGDAHAGHVETSLMLALSPQAVLVDRAVAGNRAKLSEIIDELTRRGVRAVSENGVLGDPTTASAREGERLLAQARGALRAFVTEWPDL